jgi:hypothetical protein
MDNYDYDVLVSADHVSPDYQFLSTDAKVHYRERDEPNAYWCVHPKLGCGKFYPTMTEAVEGLFRDHGCTAIRYYTTNREDA